MSSLAPLRRAYAPCSVLILLAVLSVPSMASPPINTNTRSAFEAVASAPSEPVLGGVHAPAEISGSFALITTVFNDDPTRTYICGGTTIQRDIILTSASCFAPSAPHSPSARPVRRRTRVYVGENYFREGKSRSVGAVYVHRQFVAAVAQNDVALVMLISPIPVSIFQRMRLARTDDDVPPLGKYVFTAGFGATSMSSSEISMRLMETELRVGDFDTCKKQEPDQRRAFFLRKADVVCSVSTRVKGASQPSAICLGDMGGPLFIRKKDEDNAIVQIGIVTAPPRKCTKPGQPIWFTRVLSIKPLIRQFRTGIRVMWEDVVVEEYASKDDHREHQI